MNRWIASKEKFGEDQEIDSFLSEIVEVCKKHGLSIAHQDSHGAFMIEKFNADNIEWLMNDGDYRE